MTGQAAISQCLASRTQLYDLKVARWSDEILVSLELEPERLSSVIALGHAGGKIAPGAQRENSGFRTRPWWSPAGTTRPAGRWGSG